MVHRQDLFLAVLIIAWAAFTLIRHFQERSHRGKPGPRDAGALLLRRAGFEVVDGRREIPVAVEVDDHHYDSHLIVDYIAQRQGRLYAVKRVHDASGRAGGFIRDVMLPYKLVYPQYGLLYLDEEHGKIRDVSLRLWLPWSTRLRRISHNLAWMAGGALLFYLLWQGGR
ncbi:MAG: hypothetical protein IMW91_02560 [Firmicutes bacterium]|nr:hypothetical protein [Bacillota bacterium]